MDFDGTLFLLFRMTETSWTVLATKVYEFRKQESDESRYSTSFCNARKSKSDQLERKN